MKRHGIYAGVVGVALLAGFAAGADAQQQGRYYPNGTNCSLLSDDEIVQCQNQIYQRQLESGQSAEYTSPSDQTVVPSGSDSGSGGLPGASTYNYGSGGSAGGAETYTFPNPNDIPPNNGVVTPDDGSSSD